MHVELDAVDPSATDDKCIHAGVADHHSGYIARRVRALEVLLGAAESAGVLIKVEKQYQAAMQLVGNRRQADGEMAENRDGDLGVAAASAP